MLADRLALFRSCATDAFSWGIHDPSALGWTAFGLYIFATLAALRVLIGAPFPTETQGRENLLWLLLFLALAFLAANKQLDLQTGLTTTLRCMARAEGWYEERRAMQREAIEYLVITTSMVGLAALIWLRRALWPNIVPLAGFLGLVAFVLLRAISLHHVDQILRTDILSVRVHRLIEMTALAVIIWGALRRARLPCS